MLLIKKDILLGIKKHILLGIRNTSIHELLTWPCALNNLGFTLGTILGMIGTTHEVPSQMRYLEKNFDKHLGDKLPNITKNT